MSGNFLFNGGLFQAILLKALHIHLVPDFLFPFPALMMFVGPHH